MAALGTLFSNLENQYQLPQGYLSRTRAIESANGTNLRNPNSSAKGPFQFIDSTARSIGLKDPFSETESANAAALLASQNRRSFIAARGAEPTGADLYGMHQQGSGGYLKLLGGQRTSDDAMRLNGGGTLQPSQMVDRIQALFNGAKPANLGEPAPTTAMAAPAPAAQAPAAAPDPSKMPFTGGLFGLAQGDSYTGQGSALGTMDKLKGILGDGGKGSPIASAVSGLTAAMGGGGQQQSAAPVQQLQDNSNTPNMAYMQMLMARRGRGMGGGMG